MQERYQIIKKIGQGGMGSVYQVWDNRLHKYWAMKMIPYEDNQNKEMRKLLENEAALLKETEHSLLPTVIDLFYEKPYFCMVMELVEGISLRTYLDQKGSMSQDSAIEIGVQLCEVCDYLHSIRPPIIYGDMKPENIMLRQDGSIKLIDFGASIRAKYGVTNTKKEPLLCATSGYAPPEQTQGGGYEALSAESDIYAIGATLHELLTGENPCKPPFTRRLLREANRALSSSVEHIICKCLKEKKSERYQCAKALGEELKFYKQHEKRKRWMEKLQKIVYALLLFLSALCIGIGLEGMAVEGWNDLSSKFLLGIVLGGLGVVWKQVVLKEKKATFYRMQTNLLLTEKKTLGLWSILLCCVSLGAFSLNQIGGFLPVTITNQAGQNILVAYGSIYPISESIQVTMPKEKDVTYQVAIEDGSWVNLTRYRFIIKEEVLRGKTTPLKIVFRSRNQKSNEIRLRSFLVAGSSYNHNR